MRGLAATWQLRRSLEARLSGVNVRRYKVVLLPHVRHDLVKFPALNHIKVGYGLTVRIPYFGGNKFGFISSRLRGEPPGWHIASSAQLRAARWSLQEYVERVKVIGRREGTLSLHFFRADSHCCCESRILSSDLQRSRRGHRSSPNKTSGGEHRHLYAG